MTAWQYIIAHWYCPIWQALPDWVHKEAGIPMQCGICNGMLITYSSAHGLDEFIMRVKRNNQLHG